MSEHIIDPRALVLASDLYEQDQGTVDEIALGAAISLYLEASEKFSLERQANAERKAEEAYEEDQARKWERLQEKL